MLKHCLSLKTFIPNFVAFFVSLAVVISCVRKMSFSVTSAKREFTRPAIVSLSTCGGECPVLYCIVLYCIILYFTVLYCNVFSVTLGSVVLGFGMLRHACDVMLSCVLLFSIFVALLCMCYVAQ